MVAWLHGTVVLLYCWDCCTVVWSGYAMFEWVPQRVEDKKKAAKKERVDPLGQYRHMLAAGSVMKVRCPR